MRFARITAVALSAVCALAGCAPVACPTGLDLRDPAIPISFVSPEAAIVFATDAIAITDGEIEGSRLILRVEYLGGCAQQSAPGHAAQP